MLPSTPALPLLPPDSDSFPRALEILLTVTVGAVDAVGAGAVLALLSRLSLPLLLTRPTRQNARSTGLYRGTRRLSGSGPTGPTLLRARSSVDAVGSVLLAGHFECSLETRFVEVRV